MIMITTNNLTEVINSLSDSAKKRILRSNKEYVVLYLHVFNVGSYVTIRLTNDYKRYCNVSNNGDALLCTEHVQDLINDMI